MKYHTIFFAILCGTHAANKIYSEDFAQDAQIKFEINIHPKQKKKKKRSSLKKVLVPCVYIGAAFVMILIGKKRWNYYTTNNEVPTPPPAAPPDQPPHAPATTSPVASNAGISQSSTKPPASGKNPSALPPDATKEEHKEEVALSVMPSSNSSTATQDPLTPSASPIEKKEKVPIQPNLTQLALERKKRQEEKHKKQQQDKKNIINPVPASSNMQPSNQSSFSMRALWKDIASSGIPTSKETSQPDRPDNSDSDDDEDEEKNSSSLQPKAATILFGKDVQKARKKRNYPSDSIENLIELWRKDNDISHLQQILEKDPSYLLIAVAKQDCVLIKGFLKAGAQKDLLVEEWRQDMNQLLLQDAVKRCQDNKINKTQKQEYLSTIITLDPQYLCTAVRNHKKDEDNSFIEALIESKADVHCNLKGKTPLDIAVMEEHYTCIQPLLEAKAQMTTRKHPIVWWIDNITEARRKITIAKNTNIFINIFTPNELNNTTILQQGNTFLHHAASMGASAILLALLDYNADPSLVNHHGQTPLAFAYTRSNHMPGIGECIKILEKAMGFREKDN